MQLDEVMAFCFLRHSHSHRLPRWAPLCNVQQQKSKMTFAENIALKYHINMEQKPDISSSGADPAYVNLKVREQVLQLPFTQTDLKSYDTVQPLLSFAVRSHISE